MRLGMKAEGPDAHFRVTHPGSRLERISCVEDEDGYLGATRVPMKAALGKDDNPGVSEAYRTVVAPPTRGLTPVSYKEPVPPDLTLSSRLVVTVSGYRCKRH